MNIFVFTVVGKKMGELCKIAIGSGFSIDVANGIVNSTICLFFKRPDNRLGQLTFKNVAQQATPQNCSATFIAEYVAKAWGLLLELPAIVEGTATACAQNTNYTRTASTKSTGCTQKIARHLDIICTKCGGKVACHARNLIGTAACTIKTDAVEAMAAKMLCKLGTNLGSEAASDVLVGHQARI